MRHGRLATAAGGALVSLIAAGCGGTSAHTTLPARVPSVSPSASEAGSQAAAQQVTAAYTAFNQLDGTAERSGQGQARGMLAPYVAEPYLDHLLAEMATYRARNEAASGYVVPHVTKITVNGDGALVRDCQDDSHAALADSRTGTVLPDTTGSAQTNIVATLTKGSDGRWRLTALQQLDTPCEPEPSPS